MYHDDNSDSDNDDRRNKLYVMYGGSWELVSWRDVKTLRRKVLSVKPGGPEGGAAPKVDEHHHLFRAIRLPGEYGRSWCTTSSHRSCHIQRKALSRAD